MKQPGKPPRKQMTGIKIAAVFVLIVAAGLFVAPKPLTQLLDSAALSSWGSPSRAAQTPTQSAPPAAPAGIVAPALSPHLAQPQSAAAIAPTGSVPEQIDPLPALLPAETIALPTVTPSPLPSATPLPLAQPSPAQPAPAAASVALTGVRHAWQTWNNCGPATLAMNLSYYGSPLDQAAVGAALRPFEDDKNVSPEEMAAYARAQGYQAQLRVNGDAATLRALLRNGFPVLVETWLEPEPDDGMGHYRLLTGFDDAAQRWIAYDSYDATTLISADPALYQGIYLPYAQMDALWSVFNRAYILIYPPEQEPVVRDLLGDAFDEATMWQSALAQAQAEIAADAANPFPWFNLGSSLVYFGDYTQAAAAFDEARARGLPWRMLWYQFGPFVAYQAVGRYADALALADAVLAVTTSIEEIHYWRGQAQNALGDAGSAHISWRRALELNPAFAPAQAALSLGD